jgi:hypothetical protein
MGPWGPTRWGSLFLYLVGNRLDDTFCVIYEGRFRPVDGRPGGGRF